MDESDVFASAIHKLSGQGREDWITYFDPSSYLSNSTVPFLFVNGNKDRHFNVLPYHKSYLLVPDSNRTVCIIPDLRHGHPDGWLIPEIKNYFDYFAFDDSGISRLGQVYVGDGLISTRYDAAEPLQSVRFYYSNDTESSNENRKWSDIPASYDPDRQIVSCRVPEEGFAYGFFSVVDHRGFHTSSEFILSITTKQASLPTCVLYDVKFNGSHSYPEMIPIKGNAIYSKEGLELSETGASIKMDRHYALGERLIRYHVKFSQDAKAVFHHDAGKFRAYVDAGKKKIAIGDRPFAEASIDFFDHNHEYVLEIYNVYQEAKVRIIDLYSGDAQEISAVTNGGGGERAGSFGTAIEDKTRVYWKVRSWDKNNSVGKWSVSSWWETGISQAKGWTADWIGSDRSGKRCCLSPAAGILPEKGTKDRQGRFFCPIVCYRTGYLRVLYQW